MNTISAGTAAAPSPSGASVPTQSASASTAQQIQATGPTAVAAVRALQATAGGASVAASKEATASGEETGGGGVQALEEEPDAGEGDPPKCSQPSSLSPIITGNENHFALQQLVSAGLPNACRRV